MCHLACYSVVLVYGMRGGGNYPLSDEIVCWVSAALGLLWPTLDFGRRGIRAVGGGPAGGELYTGITRMKAHPGDNFLSFENVITGCAFVGGGCGI